MTALLLILTMFLTTCHLWSPELPESGDKCDVEMRLRPELGAGCITMDLGGLTHVWTRPDIQTAPRGTHTEHKETLMT